MKLFSMSVILTLPIIAFANGFTVKEPSFSATSIDTLIKQKAQASGVVFVSNNQQYQLITGVLAVKENTDSSASLTSSTSLRESFIDLGPSLWQGKRLDSNCL